MFESLKQAYLPPTRFPSRQVDKNLCEKCKRCIEACPTAGFVPDKEGFPKPVGYGGFEEACLNCWNCVAVCPTGAISMDGAYEVPEGRYKTRLTGNVTYPAPLGPDAGEYADIEEKLTETEQVIYKRRSNRLFKKKPVPKELIHRIMEAGRFAPSAGNCQPYKFIVITNQALISELEAQAMKVLRLLKKTYLAPDGERLWWKNALFSTLSLAMPNKMDPRPFTAMEKADQTNDIIYWEAPAVILICKNPKGISNPDLDIGMAAQNMVLTAHSLGLGTCYIGLTIEPLNYPHLKKLREKLGAGHPWEPVTSIAIGYPKGKIDAVVKRDNPPIEWID